jgi:hypothetical protein
MLIRIFERHMDDLRILRSGNATGWSRWHAGQRCSRIWSPLSASDGWWCTCSVPSPVCLRILCGAISAMKAAGHVVLTKLCRVSLYHILHLFMPSKLNTPRLLVLDLGGWFLNEIFSFLYCSLRKALFGHFGHFQCQAHVGLFQLYPTCLPCPSCRHVENIQEISCCVYQ